MNIETANRLVQLRKQHGYSQEALAERLGISRQAVSKWERAESSPDTDNLILLAQLYGISLDELLRPAEAPPFWPEGEAPPAPELLYPQEPVMEQEMLGQKRRANWGRRLHIFPFPVLVAFVYLVLGFAFGKWHPGWLIFFTIPVYYWIADILKGGGDGDTEG